jgi:steroid delta-isomerase-like uncharacterized protein
MSATVSSTEATKAAGAAVASGSSVSPPSQSVVQGFFAALDVQDLASVDDLLAPGYTLHLAGSPQAMDRAGFREFAQGFFAALPDVAHVIEDQFSAGEKVMTRIVVRGTHRGDFQGIPPTGRPVAFDAINVHYVEGAHIVEQWLSFDSASLMRQLTGASR